MVIYDNEFRTKNKIEPQHIHPLLLGVVAQSLKSVKPVPSVQTEAATPNNVPFHIRLHEEVDIRTYGLFCQNQNFLDANKDNQIFLPMVLRCARLARLSPTKKAI